MKTKKAFTLVELLVVIAVIALLMSVLMPALRMARDHAMRVICGNNIREILLAMTIYADRNEGRVPENMGNIYWPWDINVDCTNQVMEAMGKKIADFIPQPGEADYGSGEDYIPVQEVFYCPANIQQKRNKELYWRFAVGSTTGGVLTGYRIWGYIVLWSARYSSNGSYPIYDTGTIWDSSTSVANPNKKWIRRMDIPGASEAEFVCESILCQLEDASGQDLDPEEFPNGNFGVITVGGMPGGGSPDQSSHLINEAKVAGGNIGFVDNHVEWRPFSEMQMRHVEGNNFNGNGPYWWW